MRTDTKKRIIEFIKAKNRVSAKEIVDYLALSKQAVFRHLNKLIEGGEIEKIGKPPKVFYAPAEPVTEQKEYNVKKDVKELINQKFFDISPVGQIKQGWGAFVDWCLKREQNVARSAVDYARIIKKYDALRKDGLLDGMKKMKSAFSKVYLDLLFYIDFYSIESFGKTKLGKTLLYAKQSQNKAMIKDISETIKPAILNLIKKYKVDSIAFIPPTVKREVQFMKELENNLNLKINKIKITKVKTPVIVPQKTLNKIEDRIENAKKTFVVEGETHYSNILLIDDAVGSGATFNEIASQIRNKKLIKGKVIGLAITGSLKGFDVISEV